MPRRFFALIRHAATPWLLLLMLLFFAAMLPCLLPEPADSAAALIRH